MSDKELDKTPIEEKEGTPETPVSQEPEKKPEEKKPFNTWDTVIGCT